MVYRNYSSYDQNKSNKKKILFGIICVLIITSLFYSGILDFDQKKIEQVFNDIEDKIPNFIKNNIDNISTVGINGLELFEDTPKNSKLVEDYIYEFTNEQRKNNGLSTLSRVSIIDTISRNHSLDMSNRGYFDHVTPEGLDVNDRGNKVDYSCKKRLGKYIMIGLGENIHYQNIAGEEKELAQSIVNSWMNSDGHRENILDKKYSKIGIGVSINSYNEVYATQNFC